MNARINSIENLVAFDPGQRNVFALALPDQLRLAAQSLRLARRVGIISGFYVPQVRAGETDGPTGAKMLGQALNELGIEVDYLTDTCNAPVFRAIGIEPLLDTDDYLLRARPTHLVAIERVGRCRDGCYRNMAGVDISDCTEPLDQLFIDAAQLGITTIGIGDGGNEIGMGKIFAQAEAARLEKQGDSRQLELTAHCVIPTDFCIVSGVSNWGAYGLTGALSVLAERDLLLTSEAVVSDSQAMITVGGAVDGVTHRHEPTTDGQDVSVTVSMLEQIRRQLAPSPTSGSKLLVGILGYGETGRAAARLLVQRGHRVRISDAQPTNLDADIEVDDVETGGHSLAFLRDCDFVVASPGVALDLPIRDELRRCGKYVVSEVELAYQLSQVTGGPSPRQLVAVTGTCGKRTTVELLERTFRASSRNIHIGGNKGKPYSDILAREPDLDVVALAVSSFQLETVVHFRPNIAIFLNLDEAHLDRHRTTAEYARVKSRIFMNQLADDILILPYDDPMLRRLARKHQGRTFWISERQVIDRGAWIEHGRVKINTLGQVEDVGVIDYAFQRNVLAALLAARLGGVDAAYLSACVESGFAACKGTR